MGTLATTHLIWFCLGWVAEVALVGYLLAHWSTSTEENRTEAAKRFFQFQSFGWLLFFVSMARSFSVTDCLPVPRLRVS